MKLFKKLCIITLSSIVLASCSNDDNPVPVNEEEVITTLTATLTSLGGGDIITLQSRDVDGDGPEAPVITVSGDLAVSTTYSGSLVILNETESPAENKNSEIEEEGTEHQFFFQVTNDLATFAYDDSDADGNPIGIEFTVTTANAAGSGTLTITLRHEPNKAASGVSDGDITNAEGSTDIQAVFPIVLQ
jgi:hypothetical protein